MSGIVLNAAEDPEARLRGQSPISRMVAAHCTDEETEAGQEMTPNSRISGGESSFVDSWPRSHSAATRVFMKTVQHLVLPSGMFSLHRTEAFFKAANVTHVLRVHPAAKSSRGFPAP